jgi:predicted CXXCH cytochrome family protein
VAALLAVLSVASVAFAYDEPNKQPVHDGTYQNHGDVGKDCYDCHRPSTGLRDTNEECSTCHLDIFGGFYGEDTEFMAASIGKGPHGVYSNKGNRCNACHTIHAAPAGIKLLPGQTVTDTCYACHDGTGGGGVYGVIYARTGVQPEATHRVDTTTTVPGGDSSDGGDATMAFTGGVGGTLGCTDCHSPHDSKTVAKWTNQRMRTDVDHLVSQGVTQTNRLLRQNPGSSTATATVYGSDWCLACHAGRVDAGPLHNHPADSRLPHAVPAHRPAGPASADLPAMPRELT